MKNFNDYYKETHLPLPLNFFRKKSKFKKKMKGFRHKSVFSRLPLYFSKLKSLEILDQMKGVANRQSEFYLCGPGEKQDVKFFRKNTNKDKGRRNSRFLQKKKGRKVRLENTMKGESCLYV